MDGNKSRLKRALSRIWGFGRKPNKPLLNIEEHEKKVNKKVEALRLEVLDALARLEQMDIEA